MNNIPNPPADITELELTKGNELADAGSLRFDRTMVLFKTLKVNFVNCCKLIAIGHNIAN